MSSIKNVLVAGASGNLGPVIVQSLIASNFNVTILTRSSTSPNSFPNTKIVQTDYSADSLATAFKDQDAVISAIGPIGTMLQTALIDAAVNAKVKRFIPSDFAFDTPNLEGSDIEKQLPLLYMRIKPKTVILKYLIQKAKESPEFTWTAIGGGPLFDWTLKTGFLGLSLASQEAIITDSGNELYPTITIAQTARAAAAVLSKENETKNKYYNIASFIASQNQIVTACEKAAGQKWKVEHTTSEERLQQGTEKLEKGDIRGIGNMWSFWCSNGGKGRPVSKDELANDFLGLPEEDMVEVVKELL